MILDLMNNEAQKFSLTYSDSSGMIVTENMTDTSGNSYTLYTITTSGTLKVKGKKSVDIWMCGGGAGGQGTGLIPYGYDGGAGAFCASKTSYRLGGEYIVAIGAGGAALSAGGTTSITQNNIAILSASGASSNSGGTGGGGGRFSVSDGEMVPTTDGTGDGITKYPFGDTKNFECHCAGGGGGATYYSGSSAMGYHSKGGDGGTNGGNGSSCAETNDIDPQKGGSGGDKGGGIGGDVIWYSYNNDGTSATFYGSGGGGAGFRRYRIDQGDGSYVWSNEKGTCGAGYQGILYIRVPN